MTFRSSKMPVSIVSIMGISLVCSSLLTMEPATGASSGHEASTTIPLHYAQNEPTPTSSTTLPTGPGISYYLSLGDSVGMWDGTRSFPYLLANRYSHSSVPGLRLIDMSCSGETTESMVKGSTCAPGGSQYDNAVSFVNAHRGHIALVTISIGGNDVVPCMSRPGAATCFVNGLSKMKSNISTIVAGLRDATGPHVPIIGMNVYDPLLGDWLAPGDWPIARCGCRGRGWLAEQVHGSGVSGRGESHGGCAGGLPLDGSHTLRRFTLGSRTRRGGKCLHVARHRVSSRVAYRIWRRPERCRSGGHRPCIREGDWSAASAQVRRVANPWDQTPTFRPELANGDTSSQVHSGTPVSNRDVVRALCATARSVHL